MTLMSIRAQSGQREFGHSRHLVPPARPSEALPWSKDTWLPKAETTGFVGGRRSGVFVSRTPWHEVKAADPAMGRSGRAWRTEQKRRTLDLCEALIMTPVSKINVCNR